MEQSLLGRNAAALCAAAALFSGCGGTLGPSNASSSALQAVPSRVRVASPIGPDARGQDLLYASSDDCAVYVFGYHRGKLVQTLNVCDLGFGPAFGLCTDKAGDVFMTMGAGFSVFKFEHGGTQPVAQLESDSLLPDGCSVDPRTGNLGISSATGTVAIYKNASGTPQVYSLSDISEYFFCTFDDRGNFFADGEHNDRSFALVELPKGASALREITVPGNRGTGYALQWDGHHVALGGTQGSNTFTIDRIRIKGSDARVIDTTTLGMAPNASVPFQFWIRNNTVIQPESGNAAVGFWNYPAGGHQKKAIPIAGSGLVGVTISAAPRR